MEIITNETGSGRVVEVVGEINSSSSPDLYKRLISLIKKGGELSVDLTKVERIDSTAVALFAESLRFAREKGCGFKISGVSPDIKRAFDLARWDFGALPGKIKRRASIFESLGEGMVHLYRGFSSLLTLSANAFYWGIVGPFKKHGPRVEVFIEQMIRMGSEALPIVALIIFLIGLVIALQSAYQLRQFGANIYIANLVAISITRELGPLISAIIVAGRSGASITAQIGSMMVNEEVDALKTMGLNPIRYLVVPRFYAMTITQPMLTVMADAIGIFGGFVIAFTYLGLSPSIYFDQTRNALLLSDIITGLIKSIVFAWIIVLVGCYKGFLVSGGAEGVGRATTSSVVTAIFMIVVADAFFSTFFYFMG